jgi:hypothetical protein
MLKQKTKLTKRNLRLRAVVHSSRYFRLSAICTEASKYVNLPRSNEEHSHRVKKE